MAGIYLLAPLCAYVLVHVAGVPLLGVLGPVFLLFVLILSLDRTFSWRDLLGTRVSNAEFVIVFKLFVILGSGVLVFCLSLGSSEFSLLPPSQP